ncbi:MAG: radical SAM protein [Myxococcota bacterium]
MKVALINPFFDKSKLVGRYKNQLPPIMPLGLGYIAAVLRDYGHEVSIIDQFAMAGSHRELAENIRKEGVALAGITCLTPGMGAVEQLVSAIRLWAPETKIALGNIHADYFYRQLLVSNQADFIVHGEGEFTMLNLANALETGADPADVKGISFLRDGAVVKTDPAPQIADLDSLPFPAWELFDLRNCRVPVILGTYESSISILASRGCPYKCTFCSQNKLFKGIRFRDMSKVVDEMEHGYAKTGISTFGFMDAMFPFRKSDAMRLASEIVKRGLNKYIKWHTEMRPDMVDLEMMQALKESGLYLTMVGIESGDDEVLKRTRKKTNVKQVEEAVKTIHKAGIEVCGLFILGLPGETPESVKKTIKFAKSLPLIYAKFNRLVPYPGTEIYEEWVKCGNGGNGNQTVDWGKFSAWSRPESHNDVLYLPDGLTARELRDFQNRAVRQFYLRPSQIAKLLLERRINFKTAFDGAKILLQNWLDEMFVKLPPSD